MAMGEGRGLRNRHYVAFQAPMSVFGATELYMPDKFSGISSVLVFMDYGIEV